MSATSGSLALRPTGMLVPPNSSAEVASFDLDSRGDAVVVWVEGDHTVVTHGPGHAPVTLDGVVPEWPMVQPFPDGRLLIVGARSEWRDGAGEHNAFVFSPEGTLERSGCLGDGIEHVKVTDDGTIWVGYFDEGIFGNLGWGMDGGPAPIGLPGLVQFSSRFELLWEFPPSDSPIDDCYAMNVVGDDVWACYYSDFDVVRVRGGTVQHWGNEVEGAKVIVANGDTIALMGGYGDERDSLVVGQLAGDEFAPTVNGRLTMPNGRRIPQEARVVGRGADLHVLVGLESFTWSLTDLT